MSTIAERLRLPSEDDTELAAEASRYLSQAKQEGSDLHVQIDGGKALRLPKAVNDLLFELLTEMARGNAVTVIPVHAELTTQEAADYLNVSRPFIIKLLEAGKLKYHMVGSHRRVRFTDLDEYAKKIEADRKSAMEELAQQAQELEMGY